MVTTEERGWPGHFCGAAFCSFRRNTLVTDGKRGFVVSTVGDFRPAGDEPMEIGYHRFYETMMFVSDMEPPYRDALFGQQVYPDEKVLWAIGKKGQDREANEMHDNFVKYVIDEFEQLERQANEHFTSEGRKK